VRHRLRRALRIAPHRRSAVHTIWLVSLRRPARLHRRLRRVGAAAREAAALDPALTPLAEDLVADAVAMEPALVAASRAGRLEPGLRHRLSAEVVELESIARRLTALSTDHPERAGDVIRLRDRVDALEAARREVADIDRQAGLHIFA
jgi:hypothetical protein